MDRIQNLLLENGYELTDRNYKILSENIDNGNKTILTLPENLDVQSINEDNIIDVLSSILAENDCVVDDENLNILCEGLFDSSILLEETEKKDEENKGTNTENKDGDKKSEGESASEEDSTDNKKDDKKSKKGRIKEGLKKAASNETVGKVVKSVAKSALLGAGAGAAAGAVASHTANVIKDKAVVDAASENATAQAAKSAADEKLKDVSANSHHRGSTYVGSDADVAARAQAEVDAKLARENAAATKRKLDDVAKEYDGKHHNVGKEALYGAGVGAAAGVGVNAAIKGGKRAYVHRKSKKK